MDTNTKTFDDPQEIIDINNKYRNLFSTIRDDDDIYTIDDIKYVGTKINFPKIDNPSKLGPKLHEHKQIITQHEYNSYMNMYCPVTMGILNRVNKYHSKIITAGEAAAKPYHNTYNPKKDINDIDFFVINSNEFTDIKEAIRVLQKEIFYELEHQKIGDVVRNITEELITITANIEIDNGDVKEIKFQIIMKSFSSISALLHSFDLGSSCIAYDGETTYMTTLGVYSQYNKINLVIPEYHSLTYDKNLIKYFECGYNLGLMDFDYSKTGRTFANIDLEYISLYVARNPDNTMVGALKLIKTDDYIYSNPQYIYDSESQERLQSCINKIIENYSDCKYEKLKMKENCDNLARMIASMSNPKQNTICLMDYINFPLTEKESKYMFNVDTFYFEDVFSINNLYHTLDHIIKFIIKELTNDIHNQDTLIYIMKKFLNMKNSEVDNLLKEYKKCSEQNPNCKVYISQTSFKKFRDAITTHYNTEYLHNSKYNMIVPAKYDGKVIPFCRNNPLIPAKWYKSSNYKPYESKSKKIDLIINWKD